MRLGNLTVRRTLIGLSLGLLLLPSCREQPFEPIKFNPDWTDESHGASRPSYAVVFPQDSVNRIDIYLGGAGWAAVRKDMTAVWGFDFADGKHPCCTPYPTGEPAYVDVRVQFKGKVWNHVGFRLKGNASLGLSWLYGNYKLPFRLKFDNFEDAYPEIWNQRLYGFKDVSMAPNYDDGAMIRERLAYDLFRAEGVAAPQAASYRVYIDFGKGPEYNGLYTMIELPEDTMLETQLGEKTGNIYKPESNLGHFDAAEFPLQNNQESPDYSDVQSLIKALNDTDLQKSNRAQWRANLEATYNIDDFLKFLAVNNAIAAFDGYGYIAHNFYLYHHSSKKLTWIPWDQNLDFNDEVGVTGEIPRTTKAFSLTMNEVDSYWPMIRYVMDDPVYFARYRGYLGTFNNNVFTQAKMDALIDKYSNMVTPYVIGPNGEQPGHTFLRSDEDFTGGRSFLKAYVANRRAVIAEFLR